MTFSGIIILILIITFIYCAICRECNPTDGFLCGQAYNQSEFPNLIGHSSLEDVYVSLYYSMPFINLKCNRNIKRFICGIHYPKCGNKYPPCKSFCEKIYEDCKSNPVFSSSIVPAYFDCNRYSDKEICFDHNGISTNSSKNIQRKIDFQCPYWLKTKSSNYQLYFHNQTIRNCGQPCFQSISLPDKSWYQTISLASIILSSLCFIFAFYTVLSLGLDTNRYSFPERGVILISICYCFIAISLIVGYSFNNETICHKNALITEQRNSSVLLVDQGSTISRSCTILFIVFYFSLVSSMLWWFVMTLTLFLSSAYHWAQESINKNTHFFHLSVWSTAALLTAILIGLGYIEGDIRLGICLPGVTHPLVKIIFLIIPLSLLLVFGSIFFFIACHHLGRVYNVLKSKGSDTSRLKRLIQRTISFSLFYIIAWVIIIAVWILDVINHKHLVNIWKMNICSEKLFGEFGCSKDVDTLIKLNYHEALFLLQLFCLLTCGCLPCILTVNRKTFITFKECLLRGRITSRSISFKSSPSQHNNSFSSIAASTNMPANLSSPYSETCQGDNFHETPDICVHFPPNFDDVISTATSSYPATSSVAETLYLQTIDDIFAFGCNEESC